MASAYRIRGERKRKGTGAERDGSGRGRDRKGTGPEGDGTGRGRERKGSGRGRTDEKKANSEFSYGLRFKWFLRWHMIYSGNKILAQYSDAGKTFVVMFPPLHSIMAARAP
jgi:hypothetical protein